jgi:hypothetical protein
MLKVRLLPPHTLHAPIKHFHPLLDDVSTNSVLIVKSNQMTWLLSWIMTTGLSTQIWTTVTGRASRQISSGSTQIPLSVAFLGMFESQLVSAEYRVLVIQEDAPSVEEYLL